MSEECIDVDDLLCDAQDYYFEGKYNEAITILNKAKEIQNDGGVYEMIVLCYLETKNYQKAFENANEWKSIAKRDTALRCRNALLRTSYLCDEKEGMKEISEKMIIWNENLSEVILLRNDMFPEEIEQTIKILQNKIEAEENDCNEGLKEILRIFKNEKVNEFEHKKLVGDEVYSVGVIAKVSLILNGICNEKDEIIKVWKEMGNENNQIVNAIGLLEGNTIANRGIHFVLRKHSKIFEEQQ